MSSAVVVNHLSKVYKHYWGPRSLLKEVLLGVTSHSRQWALKDISFELQEGEAFGVVGNNGAGKSTLLKILAGTAFATVGEAHVSGRISALLELGAGFHPEFSGRENIYFNGALQGLSREEVKDREEEIIDFSELSEFVDKPVKTYSSGMFLRLGFAVATGFDPAVLIIDEALAVGDQHFQKKCTDRIMDFRRQGKTIIFCSHNLYQVKTMCDRALWLDRGAALAVDDAARVVDRYTNELREERKPLNGYPPQQNDSLDCAIERVATLDADGAPAADFETGDTIRLDIWAFFGRKFQGTPGIAASIVRNDGLLFYTTTNTKDGVELLPLEPGHFYGSLVFPKIPLLSGAYYFNVVTTDQDNLQAYHIVERAANFTVHGGADSGSVKLEHHWDNKLPQAKTLAR
ncbi:MAG: ABC transporter ATP-binding protein [Acidobacteria bacterium]|nr:MAG: ABC transporter ATP-binding protein [Acidobacteriota bacterium]